MIDTTNTPKATSSSKGMPVTFLHKVAPAFGVPTEIAPGIWMLRLPIELTLDHVNVYLLEDEDGWVLVDTGCDTKGSRETLLGALDRYPFEGRPITRVIATHFHPDHIGLAGYFTGGKNGHAAELLTSRTTWHSYWLLVNDNPEVPHPPHIQFQHRAGMPKIDLESFKRRRPSSYSEKVARLPHCYTRLRSADKLKIGGRSWTVLLGNGHADEHVALLSDDEIAIVGDQVLPAISPSLSIHFSEPDADCVVDWLESCRDFGELLSDTVLCLPGHNRPFIGAPSRCHQLIANCEQVLARITKALARPLTAFELMPHIYRRELTSHERNLLIGETVGYLNHLLQQGEVTRRLTSGGVYIWRRNLSVSTTKETAGVRP